ncbi:hypothetical protein RSOL_437000, partial [Rhizoctonia solani AG-3 Rhs1AP]
MLILNVSTILATCIYMVTAGNTASLCGKGDKVETFNWIGKGGQALCLPEGGHSNIDPPADGTGAKAKCPKGWYYPVIDTIVNYCVPSTSEYSDKIECPRGYSSELFDQIYLCLKRKSKKQQQKKKKKKKKVATQSPQLGHAFDHSWAI